MSGKLPGTDGKPTVLPTGPKLHTLIPAVGARVEGSRPMIEHDEFRSDGPKPTAYPPIKMGR